MSSPTKSSSFVLAVALGATAFAFTTPSLACHSRPKKFGTIFKGEVDGAIADLRAASGGQGGFGDGSTRATAMMLTAMGHSHRFYGLDSGPVTRPGVKLLFAHRQSDGSFGDAAEAAAARVETTQWVVDALDVMDPQEHRTDVAHARQWLAAQGVDGPSPWKQQIAAVLDAYAHDQGDPKSIGGAIAKELGERVAARDWNAAVDRLTHLVACQVAARLIDAGKQLPQDGAAITWSPAQQKGIEFLLTQQTEGEFFVNTPGGKFPDPGLSALGIAALQTKPAKERSAAEQAVIDAGLKKLIAMQNEDGSFAKRNANYTTCAAMLALAMAGREEHKPALQRAQRYIVGIQNVEGRGYARGDRDYGSIGYGGDERGDLSNLHFAIEALRVSGLPADDEAFAKAVVFLQRTQNLRAVNDFSGRVRDDEGEWMEVTSGDDGGSAYYPGNSAAGYVELPDGRKIPRSYGSMTYALLKTYTLAGVGKDDPRVAAAVRWLEQNWTLDENPGSDPRLPEKARFQGLYYYYMVLAQALDATGLDELRVPAKEGEGTVAVHWRELLRKHLESVQTADGSWLNAKNGRWWEDQAAICTIYVLLALHHAG